MRCDQCKKSLSKGQKVIMSYVKGYAYLFCGKKCMESHFEIKEVTIEE